MYFPTFGLSGFSINGKTQQCTLSLEQLGGVAWGSLVSERRWCSKYAEWFCHVFVSNDLLFTLPVLLKEMRNDCLAEVL